MGSASCKSSRTPAPAQQTENNKNITIGVFGLDDAGKTSTVKVLEGAPTDHVLPTVSSNSTTINHTGTGKGQQRIKVIDVSGAKKFRQQSWSEFYDQIHGFIFVIDASEKNRWRENQETLQDLLEHDQLKNKPVLILANKQDQKGALNNDNELKRKLDLARLKAKYQIELCAASPQGQKKKVDESIRKGFAWLIRTIDENYTEINSCVSRTRTPRMNTKSNRTESDDNENDHRHFQGKGTDYRSKLTSEKLPSITTNKHKTKISSDDDDDDDVRTNRYHTSSSTNGLNTKRKLLGDTNNNSYPLKKSNDNEPKAFRATYETFPEETPWSTSTSALKHTKSDDVLSRLLTKPPLPGDTRKRAVSPLVRDTKSYTNGSSFKREKDSDEEGSYNRQQVSKTLTRFDSSSLPSTRFASTIKKPTLSTHHDEDDDDDDDDYNNNRRTTTTVKKSYDDDDEFENNYLKQSASMKTSKSSDYYNNKTYPGSSDRLNLNSEYRGSSAKPASRSTYDHDTNNHSSYTRKETSSKFNYDDEDDDYPPSKSVTRSKYEDDDDDDDHHQRWSSSKPTARIRFNKNHDDDDDDYHTSSSKPTTHSKFEDDDDYPSSSSRAVARSKYDDDDDYDNDYSSSSKRNHYASSSSYNQSSRPRYESNDFFTSKQDSNTTRRSQHNTGYDSS